MLTFRICNFSNTHMKLFFLTIITFTAIGCSYKRFCDNSIYGVTYIQNQTSQAISLFFCTEDKSVTNYSFRTSTEAKVEKVWTLILDRHADYPVRSNGDSCSQVNKVPIQYAMYPSLAPADSAYYKLCSNLQSTAVDENGDRIDKYYLIILKTDSCPVEFAEYNQATSPC